MGLRIKLIIICSILLFPVNALSIIGDINVPLQLAMVSPANPATPGCKSPVVVCDDCSGTLKFAWHMEDNDSTPDVTIGNPCGCADGDTIGVEAGTPVFSGTQKSDGALSLHINALDESYTFDVAGDDNIEMDNVKITFDIYIVSYPSAGKFHGVIRSVDDASNYLHVYLLATGTLVRVKYYGQANAEYVSATVATGSWVSCEYQAKTGVAGNDHYLACGGSSDEQDNDLVAMAATADWMNFGDIEGDEAGEYYIDNVKIDVCDRY